MYCFTFDKNYFSMKNKSTLFTLVAMYFFWGSVASSLDVLKPIFQGHFQLGDITSQLTSSAFFIAYFVGSLIYFLLSYNGIDILNKIGYKKGLIGGLFISIVGIAGFVLSASMNSYTMFLISLFIVAFGFSFQQIVVNPLIIAIGAPETASQRVSLGGSVFGIGATLAPLLLCMALYGSFSSTDSVLELSKINIPAFILIGLFALSIFIVSIVQLPETDASEVMERDLGALKYPQLTLGMLAIFIYVGVEVTIGFNLSNLLKELRGFETNQAAPFVSLYWGSIMILRWADAVGVFNLNKTTELVVKVVMPFIVFFGLIYIYSLRGESSSEFYAYLPYIAVALFSLIYSGKNSAKTLIILGILASIFMTFGMFLEGQTAMYCIISGGLFCSVMWPCIFDLAIAGLGKYTNQGSSLLIMMIVGGAIIPPVQGAIAASMGYQMSYIIAVFCFLYLAFYGWYIGKMDLKK
jgi:MFS transporter, FHS family, L-fucose permease